MTESDKGTAISTRTLALGASAIAIAVFALFIANGVSLALTTRFMVYVVALSGVFVIILRAIRIQRVNEDLAEEIDRLKAADTHLRARMHYMLRDAVGEIVAKSDDLVEAPDLPFDEQRRILMSIRATSQEIERTLADVASSHRDSDTATPHIRTTVLLGEELVSIASTSPFSDRFTLDIEETRALGDPAKVRQILRTLVNHTTLGEADDLTLQTAGRGSTATATVSGEGAILPPDALAALTERGPEQSDSAGYRAIELARKLAESLGGSISYLQVFGVSHVVLTLPSARSRHTGHTSGTQSETPHAQPATAITGSAAAS